MDMEVSVAIQAVSSVVIAVVALLALRQVNYMRQQLKADHERSRRHHAVKDLRSWTNHLTEGITSARRLVETFDNEQLASVRDGKPLRVPVKYRPIVDVALGISKNCDIPIEGDLYVFDAEHAIVLRNLCIRHLNEFEVTLSAWRHGIADADIIEEQLSYLVNLKKEWRMLEGFRREVTGFEAYPATHEFVNVIEEKVRALEVQNKLKPKEPIA